jgi:general secretion pathway protein H
MLVVIVILGLTAAIVMSQGPPRSAGLSRRAAAQEIVQTLRLARSEAIARGRPTTVVIEAPHRRLLLNGVGQPPLPAALALDLHAANGARRSDIAFTFAADGSTRGGIILLGTPDQRIRIAVDWLSGRVDMSNAR